MAFLPVTTTEFNALAALAALPVGRIAFGNAASNGPASSANLIWDATNDRLGIVTAAPTARLHLPAGTVAADTAPLKIDAGILLGATEAGAIESDGTNLYWTDAGAIRRTLNNTVQTLALSYTAGAVAADQTMILTDADGGGLILNGTTVGQTYVTAFEIDVLGGSVNFYRVGGFDVSSAISKAVAAGTTWNQVDFLSSTLTLTGGPATATAVTMVHVGAGVVNGAGNTVTDAYNLRIDAAPAGTATLTRSWSLGVAGAIQLGANAGLVLGAGLAPPGESDIVMAAGATAVSVANTGRLGYLAGATQQFMVSMNTGAYVPVLVGPAAGGFTAGSVPFGVTGGQLSQDNANFFWDNANDRLGIGITPTATLHVVQPAVNAAIPNAFKLTGGGHTNITASSESIGANFDFSASKQWATGALTTQREFLIQAPTYRFVGASTATNAATFVITRAPIAGTNATLGQSMALWIQDSNYAPPSGTTVSLAYIAGTYNPASGGGTMAVLDLEYVCNQTGTANGILYGILLNVSDTAVLGTHNPMAITIGGTSRFIVNRRGGLTIAPVVVAGATAFTTAFTVTGAAHTTLTAAAEVIGVNLNMSATKQWATGSLTTQREVLVQAPTYGFVGASTVTTAATFTVTGAPLPGTNATLSNTSAILVQGSYAPSVTSIISQFATSATYAPTAGAGEFRGLSLVYTINQTGGASGLVTGIIVKATETAVLGGHNLLDLQIVNTSAFLVDRFGNTTIAQRAVSGASATTAFSINSGSHTTLGATSERGSVVFFFNPKQWATGAIATQREVQIFAPTYTFVGASTITTAATVAIAGSPVAGTNATITRTYALWVQDGATRIDGGQTIKGTDVNVAGPYTVLITDYYLEVRRTATAAITINLPSIATVGNGRIIIIGDSGYNAAVNNITFARNGTDNINNVAGNYVQNVSGAVLWLKANTTTSNWEII